MGFNKLEKQVRQWLKEEKKITVECDCGGDEALLYPFIDGVELPYDTLLGEAFYELLLSKLDLPSAGEYFVKGGGYIVAENDEIVIYHDSESSGFDYSSYYDSYDGETPEVEDIGSDEEEVKDE